MARTNAISMPDKAAGLMVRYAVLWSSNGRQPYGRRDYGGAVETLGAGNLEPPVASMFTWNALRDIGSVRGCRNPAGARVPGVRGRAGGGAGEAG